MKKLSKKRKFRLKLVTISIVLIVILLSAVFLIVDAAYANKMYPKVTIAGISVAGKSKDEAKQIITAKAKDFLAKKPNFTLEYQGKLWYPTLSDLGAEINIDSTIKDAFHIGHEENFIVALFRQIESLFGKVNTKLVVDYNSVDFNYYFKPIKQKLEIPYQNDSYKINEDFTITDIPSKEGKGIDEEQLKKDSSKLINNWQVKGKINLVIRTTYPKVTRENSLNAKIEAEKIISAPIVLIDEKNHFEISRAELAGMTVFLEEQIDQVKIDPFSSSVSSHFKLRAGLSKSQLEKYGNQLSTRVNTLPKNAKLRFVNGRLRVLEKSIPGKILDEKKLVEDIKIASLADEPREIQISVNEMSSEISEENLAKLGIKELISTGVSDFSGSPNNRRHNIAVGASMFNGVIIKPNEEFSFTTTLGDVSAKTGYLPELVIKEDKTIPEYGGGLCQVSTTTFRAAVLAGLPIIERYPHSYRVKYYDWPYGPGFDSTVYIPHPDLRFKNDTGHHILIQTYISGSRLYFELYGTKGKRTTKVVGPRVLKYLSGGALKTEFYQYVYENGKLVRKTRFYSFYDRPDKYHTNTTPKPAATTTKKKKKTTTTTPTTPDTPTTPETPSEPGAI